MLGKLKELAALRGAYRDIFESPKGQLVLAHICKTAFVWDTTFSPGQPETTAHHEGMRRLALSIVKYSKRNINDLLQHIERQQNENPTES